MSNSSSLPPIRATIFDMDGLLIDSEELYTKVTNTILAENNKPPLPWSIKAQLQGRPGPESSRIFQEWAKLPISPEQFMHRQKELQKIEFPNTQPLPGVERLLQNLSGAKTMAGGKKVWMAVATSSHRYNYEVKTNHLKKLMGVFPERQIVVGDDVRIPSGRGKPLPDIYLLALQVLNTEIDAEGSGEPHIRPEECLVFEDSVPGVEAGRRAGMRVVWCPHPGLLEVYQDRIEEVLAGRTGEHKEGDLQHQSGIPLAGSPGQVGEIEDGWAERLSTLEDFNYEKYGINVGGSAAHKSEGAQPATPGMTDKDLEEMTARADGKSHAKEEGTPRATHSPVPGMAELNPKV